MYIVIHYKIENISVYVTMLLSHTDHIAVCTTAVHVHKSMESLSSTTNPNLTCILYIVYLCKRQNYLGALISLENQGWYMYMNVHYNNVHVHRTFNDTG